LKTEFKLKELGKAKHILVVRGVCEEWDFTISTPVYSRNSRDLLFLQRKQGLHPNGAPFDSKKVSGMRRSEFSKEGWCIAHRFSRLQETQNCSPSLTLILLHVKDQEKADLQPAFSFVIVCRGMIFIFSA
jgi:hypothetical protein